MMINNQNDKNLPNNDDNCIKNQQPESRTTNNATIQRLEKNYEKNNAENNVKNNNNNNNIKVGIVGIFY